MNVPRYNLSGNAVQEISNLRRTVVQEVLAKLASKSNEYGGREKQVRVAKTTSFNHDYPTGIANQYEVRLGKPSFDIEKVGLQGAIGFEEYEPEEDNVRVARMLTPQELPEGTEVNIRLCHEQWYIVTGGTGSTIVWEADTSGYGEGSELCADKVSAELESLRVKVLRRPCGVSTVFGEDEDEYVTVHDDAAGGFLLGRTESDVSGITGFATLLAPKDYGECEWVITWINWFEERQFVQDWYVSGLDIIEEKVNAHVWDWCRLPDEITKGVDCAGGYSE